MNWKQAIRIGLVAAAGVAGAIWILAIPTIPGSHRPSDAFARWRLERERRPRTLHRDCGWRIVLCEELPRISGPVGGPWDTMTTRLETFNCGFTFFTSCYARKGDTLVVILIEDDPAWVVISRSWAPRDLPSEYERLERAFSAQYGPPHLCPQSDDLASKEDRKWQLAGRYVGIVKVMDSLVEVSTGEGRIGCHIGP